MSEEKDEVTVCVECKYCKILDPETDKPHPSYQSCLETYQCLYNQKIDPLTGELISHSCSKINFGDCPCFKQKET